MITGNQICLKITADGNYYVQVPIACQVSNVRATCQTGNILESTVTLYGGSEDKAVGQAKWTTSLGVTGAKAVWTRDTTTPLSDYADRKFAKDEVIKVTVALTSAQAGIFVQIDLDPYALS